MPAGFKQLGLIRVYERTEYEEFMKGPVQKLEITDSYQRKMSPVSQVSVPAMSGFMTVPSVQELTRKQLLQKVPEKYIRSDEDRPSVKSSSPDITIPIIDLKALLGNNVEEELRKLHMACEEWGFFQLINHEVPHSLIEGIKGLSHQFFKLPSEEKQKHALQPNDVQGYGQQYVSGHDQTLDWGDMMFIKVMPMNERDMSYWPTKPENFREILDAYSLEIKKVSMKLLTLIAKNLNLKPHYFNEKFGEDNRLSLRLNYYPPCPQPELVLGIHPHSDAGGITLMVQDDDIEGLNIKKGDSWISVKPVPNAFLVNIADILEIMSNGKYKSVIHRVLTDTERERVSIAAFYSPSYSAEIGPAPDLVDQSQHPPLYKTLSHAQFLRHFLVDKRHDQRALDFVKLESTST